jgi:hypothetical protein
VGNLAADLCRPQLREPFTLNHPGWLYLAAAECRGTLGSLAMFTANASSRVSLFIDICRCGSSSK